MLGEGLASGEGVRGVGGGASIWGRGERCWGRG